MKTLKETHARGNEFSKHTFPFLICVFRQNWLWSRRLFLWDILQVVFTLCELFSCSFVCSRIMECISLTVIRSPVAACAILFSLGKSADAGMPDWGARRRWLTKPLRNRVMHQCGGQFPTRRWAYAWDKPAVDRMQVESQYGGSSCSSLQFHPLLWRTTQGRTLIYEIVFLRNPAHSVWHRSNTICMFTRR